MSSDEDPLPPESLPPPSGPYTGAAAPAAAEHFGPGPGPGGPSLVTPHTVTSGNTYSQHCWVIRIVLDEAISRPGRLCPRGPARSARSSGGGTRAAGRQPPVLRRAELRQRRPTRRRGRLRATGGRAGTRTGRDRRTRTGEQAGGRAGWDAAANLVLLRANARNIFMKRPGTGGRAGWDAAAAQSARASTASVAATAAPRVTRHAAGGRADRRR
jgi:hypothetical protein